jgi:hypothetical protein
MITKIYLILNELIISNLHALIFFQSMLFEDQALSQPQIILNLTIASFQAPR